MWHCCFLTVEHQSSTESKNPLPNLETLISGFLINSNIGNIWDEGCLSKSTNTNLSSPANTFTSTAGNNFCWGFFSWVDADVPDLQIKRFAPGKGKGSCNHGTPKRLSFQSPGRIYSHRHKIASVFKEVVNRNSWYLFGWILLSFAQSLI